jgi:hypothetical protein
MQNLQSKTPYKFKKSYGGTPEPQTPQDAPWLHWPSLNNKKKLLECSQNLVLDEYCLDMQMSDAKSATILKSAGHDSAHHHTHVKRAIMD